MAKLWRLIERRAAFLDTRVILVIAAAVGLWIPFAYVGWLWSHDLSGYVLRTVEWAAEVRAGRLYPRWAPDLYGGYGEPLFIFFAPTVYALAGSLSAAFLDPFWALKVVALLGSVFAGTSTYALIFGETRDRDAAFLGAIAYLAAPYRIGNLFARGDISEFCCLAVLPAAMALYLASAREVRPFRARALAAAASIAHALMIVTHTVLGLWGTLIVGLVVLARVIVLTRRGLWRRVPVLILALACAPAVAGFYIVPAMAYRDMSHAAGMVLGLYKPQNQWIGIQVLFDANHALFGKNFMQIGPILVAAAVATAGAAVMDFKRARTALGWLALSFVLIGLMLPIAMPLWAPGLIPLGQFIQFPWRLLGPAALSACVALGVAVGIVTERLKGRVRFGIVLIGGAALFLLVARPVLYVTQMRRADILTDPDSIRATIQPATSADEFLPAAVPAPPTTPRRDVVAGATDASVESSASDGSRHTLVVNVAQPGAVVQLALHAFPGWQAKTDSGPAVATLHTDAKGLLFVRFPSGGRYQVEVIYENPSAVHLGWLVTGFSLLMLCGMLLKGSILWPLSLSMLRGKTKP